MFINFISVTWVIEFCSQHLCSLSACLWSDLCIGCCVGFLQIKGVYLGTLVASWLVYFSFENSFMFGGNFETAAKYFVRNLRLLFTPSGRRFWSFRNKEYSFNSYVYVFFCFYLLHWSWETKRQNVLTASDMFYNRYNYGCAWVWLFALAVTVVSLTTRDPC
jgi:hypothetical protein